MGGRIRGEMSVGMERARERFEAWRRTRAAGERIPDRLWTLAVKLASRDGLSRTAGALKLDYNALKHRVEAGDAGPVSVPGTFVELPPSPLSTPPLSGPVECVIELEDGCGARMRVQLRGCEVPDVVALGRSFWNGE
jgi:hypothetical protein